MKKIIGLLLLSFLVIFAAVPITSSAATLPTYSITDKSNPLSGAFMKFSTYNKSTKHYYVIRSYLEKFEKQKGGTLILKKGTYSVSNTLYVPSNVTIILEDGVKIVKSNVTGTKSFGPSRSIFQLIRPSLSAKKGVYGKYGGEKNISFIGKGTAIIDLRFNNDNIAIIAGHNQNIKVENIRFQNMKSGHFIEMDATSNASIKNNVFENSVASPNKNKEAINLDTPDRETQGWSQQWSKYDKTPNRYVTIEKNIFKNLDRSVGTHKYSGGSYHDHITFRQNTIENMRNDAIRVMNWSNAVIENNVFRKITDGTRNLRGILASGALNPTFQYNHFEAVARPIQFLPWQNSGPGSNYAITYNKLTEANLEALKNNTVTNSTEDFIRINSKFNIYDDTVKVYLSR
ncbi:right-handed parallel beta-helix repeat-containing protein [Peribacillus sp. SCS-155]|uniref:right-handed parallel beta-helix repeat-containing protein n=1 Tax=Peribacillus sedimenti TaxID=3115297 RepID=UPI0039063F60